MIKIRVEPESNYKGIFCKGKTLRIPIDQGKPITELRYPEFYDVKLTSRCLGACPWCYMDSKESDTHVEDAVEKILGFFGPMTKNQRPFQLAIGGGECTLHPRFREILDAIDSLGIVPNYTTNGMHVTDQILSDTLDYCGGVAVSCHPHLKDHWTTAAHQYAGAGVRLNFHLIISDKESIDYFLDVFNTWKDVVEYFVLLPYEAVGRATPKEIESDLLFKHLLSMTKEDSRKIAFGANFYTDLLRYRNELNVSLYEPESMSKYLDLKDMMIYPSSFSLDKGIPAEKFLAER